MTHHTLRLRIESLLFLAGRSMSVKKLAEITMASADEVTVAAEEIMKEYNQESRGVHVMKAAQSYQMATNPAVAHVAKDFIKSEQSGELTKPSLETLTIVAYRGPITKAELEQIRGVNCSLILRNLLIKGLIEFHEDKEKMAAIYQVTMEFLQFLGVHRVEELPDYDRLHRHEHIEQLLKQQQESVNTDEAPVS
ncbi:MAG: SMC-Scp complex subunit ScpB [Candidatus Kerfeldbacteria bacterium RIFCSPLOWO2_01_FULL_48_11]|uniref:SMC-Scp complex subunit ScpB n=1 Tax=Candidatus Kerfeldbacteria bacterium RIFCSPLOWO2_01_FULL_48_11 TaxID=1798543 RepID=A0A1G2B853_9BACT|nr:MAG: Segregation and condensation protein B [Parcubacteria group bacterium GW2011_GWA2_48_9]KKW15782.1 MAG: Segregation and condensation protein B [Parcubacteria group bacterium GW2011_GWC2_49_9]OGY84407.1 MAG: SMC-Scp complex subunit ScpB [Candidatus Kerfeldbacteria bacterium RIFCSPLOWO2_01_FULL_48_11]HCJ52229.1 SMC-Scp complex subunit ScpB [Candidatus Kerfeldbacteria bacterium]HCM68097.1 SMC-Scp complex subunit ScpB [Candidatus Kerfeldbacteria bacterium]